MELPKNKSSIRSWSYFILYCVMIVFFTHKKPLDPSSYPFPKYGELVHCVEYFFFAILLQKALLRSEVPRSFWYAFGGTSIFAVGNALYLSFFSNGGAWSTTDYMAVGLGIGLAMFLLNSIYRT